MDELDRLDWRAGIAFTSYGRSIGIRVTDETVMDDVLAALPPGWRPRPSPYVERLYSVVVGDLQPADRLHRMHLVYVGVTRATRAPAWDGARRVLETDIKLYVAEYARRRVFVHAGVVAHDGGAILIPAASRAGKSTLVAALLERGAHYLSDEYAVLDADG